MSMLSQTRVWGEMIKFSHSIFALPFALIATFMAGRHLPGGLPRPGQLLLVVACMVSARSFAMTFNRIADAAIDARNPRTGKRPIPSGRITVAQAWMFLGISGTAFLLACSAFAWIYGNAWPIALALPTLAFVAGYSFTKRFTSAAHFVLGAAIAFAPVAAWIAVHPASVGAPAMILSAAVLFWIAGFDIVYACQDFGIDRRDGLFSLPARIGVGRALMVSRVSHFLTVLLLIVLGRLVHFGGLYWAGLAAMAVLLVAEQAVVRPNDLSRVNLAFFTLNGCVSILFGIATIADLLV